MMTNTISCELRKWSVFNLLKPNDIENICMVFVYGDESLFVTTTHTVYGFGKNSAEYLNSLNKSNVHQPIQIKELSMKHIKTFVYSSGLHILTLTCDGTVYSWINTRKNVYSHSTIMKINIRDKFIVNIACGSHHFIALTDGGEVYEWVSHDKIDIIQQYIPQQVKSVIIDEKVVGISCGNACSIVVTDSGKVFEWKYNETEYMMGCVRNEVNSLKGIKIEKVVCGFEHTLALSDKGCLYVWGENKYGQLGLGTKVKNSIHPVLLKIKEMGEVLDVAASNHDNISVAVGEDNRIFIWGECLGQFILTPIPISLESIHDAFAFYAKSRVMHQPLILEDVGEEKSLMDCLKEAFNDSTTSDLTIQVEGVSIFVHKAMLKIRSQYFRTMFQDHWTENNDSVIKHSEYSYKIYKAFLKYLYTGEIDLSIKEEKDFLELLKLADRYSDSQLQKCCIQVIEKTITVHNVAVLYSAATQYNAKELEESCFNFAMTHLTDVVQCSNFTELKEDAVKTFLIKAAGAGAFKE